MPSPQLPVPLPPDGSPFGAALPYAVAVLTALLGWFGAQFTAGARLQKTLLDASRTLVAEAQTRHSADGARITELESEIIRLRGEVRGHQQWEDSVRRWAQRAGLHLPSAHAED